jgi:hypothetical protein
MATRDVFTEEQLARLRGFPEISQVELFRYFTLAAADEEFVRGFRRPENVFGVAVQLCTMPWLGYVPDEVAAAPAAVARLSERLRLPVGTLGEYGEREQTRTDHLVLVARYLGWRRAGRVEWKELAEYLFARAMEHDSPTALFRLACEHLMSSRVLRPGVIKVLERVATARKAARASTWDLVGHLVTPVREPELDAVLVVDPLLGRTPLSWLGQGATNPSPGGVKTELEKLAYLRRLDAHELDLSMLPDQRRRWLARIADRSTAQQLARRDPVVRHPILLAWLSQTAVDVLDEVLLMFDLAVSARESHAKEKTKARLAERAKTGEVRQRLLDEILDVVFDVGVDDEQVGGRLRGEIGMERMRAALDTSPPRLPRDHGHLGELAASISYLRQFTPKVLAAVRFAGGTDAAELLRAVSMLAELYATGGRKVPNRRRRDSCRRGGRVIWPTPIRPGTSPPTGTTESCACCRRYATGCAAATCTCRAAGASQTRRRSCSPGRSGSRSGWSTATRSAGRRTSTTPWRWPRTCCTPTWPTWRGSSPPAAARERSAWATTGN